MRNEKNTKPKPYTKHGFLNKKFFLVGIIVLIVVIFIDYYFTPNIQNFSSKDYKSSNLASLVVKDSIEDMLNHQMFTDFCLRVLQEKHNLDINSISMRAGINESICYFHKSFKRKFFNSIFGPKYYIYRGSLKVKYQIPPLTSTKGEFSFESEWIKYYNDNWNLEADRDQFKHLLNEYLILNDIRKGNAHQ